MDDMDAFERQVADELVRRAGPVRPVPAAAILSAVVATQSPRWRFGPMFSATRYVVAAAIVALFGGFLLTGVLTAPPSHDSNPAALGTATASPDPSSSVSPSAGPTIAPDMEVQTDRVPSLELRREEIRPGVFRVLSDGIRDLEAGSGVRGVAVDPVGRVWVLRGSRGDWTVEQLGVPGVALDPSGARVTLGNFGGTPLITDDGRSMSLEDGSWVEVEGSSSSGCIGFTVPVRDGACWGLGLGRAATERLRSLPVSELAMRRVRSGQWERLIPAELGMERLEGDQGESLSPTDLGLPDGRILDYFTITPDGTVWVAVRSVSPGDVYPTALAGLLRYDGETWTLVPARLSDAPEDALAWTVDLSVTPDGTVWVVEGSPEGVRVRGWDGSTWSAHLASDVPEDWASGGVRAGGTHANADGTIWFLGGRLYFDGESLHPLDPARLPGSVRSSLATYGNPSITPDGTIWLATSDATSDGRLYAITPEAVVVSE